MVVIVENISRFSIQHTYAGGQKIWRWAPAPRVYYIDLLFFAAAAGKCSREVADQDDIVDRADDAVRDLEAL